MANGNGGSVINKVIVGIAIVGITGGVGLAIAQGRTATQVENNRSEIERRAAAVESVDVIRSDIDHLVTGQARVESENKAAHAAIISDMNEKHAELLRVIRAR
jgi:hypothetical protein